MSGQFTVKLGLVMFWKEDGGVKKAVQWDLIGCRRRLPGPAVLACRWGGLSTRGEPEEACRVELGGHRKVMVQGVVYTAVSSFWAFV